MTKVTISSLSPATWSVIVQIIDPARLAHQQSHPRYQPEWTLLATSDSGEQGVGLLTHTRWQRQRARFEVAEVSWYGSNDPELIGPVLAAAADAAAAVGLGWLRCTLPLRLASQWGMVAANLWSRTEWSGGNGLLAPATVADIADLVALDLHAPAPRSVTPLRFEPDWHWLLRQQPPLVLRNRSGQVCGYIELAGDSLINGRAIDAATARLLLAQSPSTMRNIRLPADHPLTQAALEQGATLVVRRPSEDEVCPLWSIIDPLAALRSYQPALSDRLARSQYAGWEGSIGLRGEWGAIRIEFRSQQAHISTSLGLTDIELRRLSIGGLATLLLGRRSVSDLHATGDLHCPDHGLELLESLFPTAL